MIELFLLIAVAGLLLLIGYVVSVFANAVYINPEDIEAIFPELSEHRKGQLEQFTSNPRAFFQVAFLVRITSAIMLGIIAYILALKLTFYQLAPPVTVFIVVFAAIWFLTILSFIYFPRRMVRDKTKARLIRFLPMINVIYRISLPASRILRKIAPPRQVEAVSEDQKDDIVERAIETLAESAGIGTPIIEEDEKEMIHQIFQLDVTEVREIMVPRVNMVAFDEHTDIDTIRKTTKDYGYSRYPVYRNTIDNIIGIIKVKDLLQLTEYQCKNFNLREHIRKPVLVGEQRKIDQLLSEFKKTKTHMAIVLDEFGGTAGLVTLEDVIEEIVGDIRDEDDIAESEIIRLKDGNLQVSGALPLEDLADELNLELEQDKFETVGGMIYDLIGSVPNEGVTLTWKNCKIKVIEVEGQRIKTVLVVPPALPSQ